MKALALLSGGLDSHLAIKIVQDQGIDVEALNFITIFCNCTSKSGGCKHEASKASESLGIKLRTLNMSAELLPRIKSPKYGYGRHLNPCLDCRVLMFKKAKEYMQEIGAEFLITGEVLDSRPMSQTKQSILFIEQESGLDGLILRPLSAKDFKPTIAEEAGLINRDKLFGIKGRTRKRQIKLAEELGVVDYPCPAGGCLLTDPDFSYRLGDLLDHQSDSFGIEDVKLLKYGRHFRISKKTKIVVGRDERDNVHIERLSRGNDIILKATETNGPAVLLRSELLTGQMGLEGSSDSSGSNGATGSQSVLEDVAHSDLVALARKFAAAYGKSGTGQNTNSDKSQLRKYLIKSRQVRIKKFRKP